MTLVIASFIIGLAAGLLLTLYLARKHPLAVIDPERFLQNWSDKITARLDEVEEEAKGWLQSLLADVHVLVKKIDLIKSKEKGS